MAIVVVQASSPSSSEKKDQNALKRAVHITQGLNSTTTTSSVAVSTQKCDVLIPDPGVQGCSCSIEEPAAQAMDDALTMVLAVMKVSNYTMYSAILEKDMGGSVDGGGGSNTCQTNTASDSIGGEFPSKGLDANTQHGQQRWHT